MKRMLPTYFRFINKLYLRYTALQQHIRPYIDIRHAVGALLAMLFLRILFGLWAIPISNEFPITSLEQQVDIISHDAPFGLWLQRVAVMPWFRYDGIIYENILTNGYSLTHGTLAFHPFYLMLASVLARLNGNSHLTLLLVSTLASYILTIIFTRYTAETLSPQQTNAATWLLYGLPPSFILFAPYTESTFMVFAVGSMWSIRHKRWWLAGVLAGCATLTRQQGIALALPLAWGLYITLREQRLHWHTFGSLLCIPCAYGSFTLYRIITFGDTISTLASQQGLFALLHTLFVSSSAQSLNVGQRIAWPWEGLIDQIQLILITPYNYFMLIDLILGWSGVFVVLFGLRHLNTSEKLYSLAIVGLALCYYNGIRSPYIALPRHVMLAFPLYYIVARWAAHKRTYLWLFTAGMLMNLFLAGLFVRWGWIP